MKYADHASALIGVHSGSCGKQEMLDRDLNEMQKQQMKFAVVDSQKELEALSMRLQEKK